MPGNKAGVYCRYAAAGPVALFLCAGIWGRGVHGFRLVRLLPFAEQMLATEFAIQASPQAGWPKNTSAGNAPCHRPVGGGSAAGLFRRSSRLRANVCAWRWALGCLVRLLRPRIRFLRENDGKLRAWLARCLHPCVVIYPVATTRLSRSSTGRCCRGHGLFPGSGVCL